MGCKITFKSKFPEQWSLSGTPVELVKNPKHQGLPCPPNLNCSGWDQDIYVLTSFLEILPCDKSENLWSEGKKARPHEESWEGRERLISFKSVLVRSPALEETREPSQVQQWGKTTENFSCSGFVYGKKGKVMFLECSVYQAFLSV